MLFILPKKFFFFTNYLNFCLDFQLISKFMTSKTGKRWGLFSHNVGFAQPLQYIYFSISQEVKVWNHYTNKGKMLKNPLFAGGVL